MSSIARIQNALEKKFSEHRLVFWYDDELVGWRDEYDTLQLSGVTKLEIKNNEFGVKHRIACLEPTTKFLLYFAGQRRPEDPNNWLLDQLLANGGAPFFPDRATLAQIEAGLPPEYRPITVAHLAFFASSDRTNRLRALLKNDDTERQIRLKMLAIVYRTEANPEAVLLAQFSELARNADERWVELAKFNLVEVFWQEIQNYIGYQNAKPSLLDLTLAIFRSVMPDGTGATHLDQRQAAVFMSRWKDSQTHRESYATLSERAAHLFNLSQTLGVIEDIKPWMENDAFRLIDLRIITNLRDGLISKKVTPAEVQRHAEKRSTLFWAKQESSLAALYGALGTAATLVDTLARTDLSIESAESGVRKYADSWWRIDQLYRQFLHHRQTSGQQGLLEGLTEWVEGCYLNQFVSPLAVRWQEWVDRMDRWEAGQVFPQREFHSRFVLTHTRAGRKVLVVISDAMRYEVARELVQRIQGEERWTATVQPMLGALPSFTQLGMAALLPHRELSFGEGQDNVLADGLPTAGTDNRDRILREAHAGKAGAMQAKDFLTLNTKVEGRDLFRENEVIYIYHNAIDAVGDKRDTEHETGIAVEKALTELVKILKKAAAINFSTMLVTADHGFLYQDRPLEDPDFFTLAEPLPTESVHRRFITQEVKDEQSMLLTFSHEQLGLVGKGTVSFPKGIQRLRKQGSGSRYVHGGVSLQEVVVPVIEVRKERTNEVTRVQVDVVRTGSQITSGQVAVTFVQTDPVADKCLPVELRIGFYSKSGVLLSDTKKLRFDSTESDIRQRERIERFLFSKEAENFNNQDIVLKLESVIVETNQLAIYAEHSYRLRRAFESDFDDV
jgi:uncharacterized protein (TIGR02687 family)